MEKTRSAICAIWFCIVPVFAGAIALTGWAIGDERLKSVVPGLIAMNPLTAICFLLAGAALWLRQSSNQTRGKEHVAVALAATVAATGGLKVSSYMLGFDLPIDRLLFAAGLGDNRMAPNTALCFLLSGIAIAGLDRMTRRGGWPAQLPALAVATIALVSLVGYGYGATSMYQMASYVPMALNTAAAFGVLALGILLTRSDRGVVSVIFDAGPGGVMARRMLPAVIVVPCLIGWLRIVGQRMGFYDTEFGAALMVALNVTIFVVAVGWIAAALNRSDVARRRAEESLRRFNEQLERRVAERTAELAAANADLLQKNQENEMFVYSVSHDLRSPLVNLQGFSQELGLVAGSIRELIADGGLDAERQRRGLSLIDTDMQRGLHYIQTAVSRLGGIIDALLRLSRAGRVEYQPQPICTDQLVTRVLEAMSATIFDRGAKVDVQPLRDCCGDPTATEQVFANLIGNAVNYLDPERPGEITVGCLASEREPASSVFFVRDNGLGIDPAYHGKVFQALKRLHPNVAKGEGIGLAIVKRIVERHGGEIWFESAAGEGATFFVRLPNASEKPDVATDRGKSYPTRSTNSDHRNDRNPVGGRR